MGKIVAIVSSPRVGGNSNAIVDAITDGAMGLSTNVIKLYRLDALRNVHGCKACMGCKTKGSCVQQDDLTPVLEDIRDADCVIFSSPNYFGETNAQYKLLQDRMYSFFGPEGSTLPKGKSAIVVMTGGGPEEYLKPAADKMADIIKGIGFEIAEVVVYSDQSGKSLAKDNREFLHKMKELGMRFRNNWPA